MSLPERLAFIDVESTGAHPARDRLTEIAIVRVEYGAVVARWESLVAPGVPIPPLIQNLVGITDEMVAGAPSFADIADTVATLLDGCVFVAHNARFDYGFIKNAFGRMGRDFDAPVLCTVKLSRALYPEHHRHGLDALIERHGLTCTARHRAMGDVDAIRQFVGLASDAFAPDVLAHAVKRAMKVPPQPPGLPEGVLEGVPDAPGAYLFFTTDEPPQNGRADVPLYIGSSTSLRSRVKAHFSAAHGKDAELARKVRRLDWIETAGELGALLLEAELLSTLQPSGKHVPQGANAFALRLLPNRRRPPIFERVPLAGTDPLVWGEDVYGVFRGRDEADALLRELALAYRLCPRRLGLEGGSGPCAAHLAGRCAGVCAGHETLAQHDTRLLGALGAVRLKPWPWSGAVVVKERNEASGREAFHLFDHWCHLASVDQAAAVDAQLCQSRRIFDADLYRLLGRWLAAPAHRALVYKIE